MPEIDNSDSDKMNQLDDMMEITPGGPPPAPPSLKLGLKGDSDIPPLIDSRATDNLDGLLAGKNLGSLLTSKAFHSR